MKMIGLEGAVRLLLENGDISGAMLLDRIEDVREVVFCEECEYFDKGSCVLRSHYATDADEKLFYIPHEVSPHDHCELGEIGDGFGSAKHLSQKLGMDPDGE